jgi:hypothetical protein
MLKIKLTQIYQPVGIFIIALCCINLSCKKGFLDERPNKALVVPTTIKDFQALLDETNTMNSGSPALGELGADDYYLDFNNWQGLPIIQKGAYIWDRNLFVATSTEWNGPFKQIYYSNVVLDGVQKIARTSFNQDNWDNVKGSAFFFRANAYYNLLQIFTQPLDSATASSDLGLPLKLTSNVQEKYKRNSLQETYDHVIKDLNEAKSLLPNLPLYKTRPSRAAVFSCLARFFLSVGNYDKAFLYADSALSITNKLMDYNDLLSSSYIPLFNDEVIFHEEMNLYQAQPAYVGSDGLVDSNLYKSYVVHDLRKELFFYKNLNSIYYLNTYTGNGDNFSGYATDELFLIRAECYARKRNTDLAMADLNALLDKRWETGTFVPITAISSNDALRKIISERRKELCFRGLRWTDLRRLNKDPRFAVTLTRILNNQTYSLPPNDPRYTFPLPQDEVDRSGIPQNSR